MAISGRVDYTAGRDYITDTRTANLDVVSSTPLNSSLQDGTRLPSCGALYQLSNAKYRSKEADDCSHLNISRVRAAGDFAFSFENNVPG